MILQRILSLQISRNGLAGVVKVLRQPVADLRASQLHQRPIRMVVAEPYFQAGIFVT
jgi:hypothetical protein